MTSMMCFNPLDQARKGLINVQNTDHSECFKWLQK